jgi:hypothetical protein
MYCFMARLRHFISALALMTATLSAHISLAQSLPKFPAISLTAGVYVIKAEVASTEAQREQGLMFREKMGTNEGMVFLFDSPSSVCMWMKNTLIPLSVAFLDKDGKIINIEDMEPQTTEAHCAKKPAQYALEMNRGWFKQKNIKPNSVIKGLPG